MILFQKLTKKVEGFSDYYNPFYRIVDEKYTLKSSLIFASSYNKIGWGELIRTEAAYLSLLKRYYCLTSKKYIHNICLDTPLTEVYTMLGLL